MTKASVAGVFYREERDQVLKDGELEFVRICRIALLEWFDGVHFDQLPG